jgi:hypothetical protein
MKDIKVSNYTYIVSAFDIIIKDKTYQLTHQNITEMGIEKNFDMEYFPLLYVKLALPPTTIIDIYRNKTIVKFRMRLDKVVYGSNYKKTVFDEIFITFLPDDKEFFNEDMYKQTKKVTNEEDITTPTDLQQTYEFYLFNERDINSSNTVLNTVLTNVTMTDVVYYLLSSSNTDTVLMSKLDNTNKYNEIIILPKNIIKNIEVLNAIYGFYNHGVLLFYDLNTTYFIDKNSMCTAYRVGEYTDVIISVPKSTSTASMVNGSYKDIENGCYIISVQSDLLTINSTSLSSQQLEGSTTIYVSPSNGDVVTFTPDLKYRDKETKQVIVNNFNNKFTEKELYYKKIENDCIVSFPFKDIDIDILSPNKRFKLDFEDSTMQKNRGGNYRVFSLTCIFTKRDSDFSVQGTCTIKRG